MIYWRVLNRSRDVWCFFDKGMEYLLFNLVSGVTLSGVRFINFNQWLIKMGFKNK
jgi:hypothetical protein